MINSPTAKKLSAEEKLERRFLPKCNGCFKNFRLEDMAWHNEILNVGVCKVCWAITQED